MVYGGTCLFVRVVDCCGIIFVCRYRQYLEMAGGGVCVSFDKWNLMRSDKIVLEVSGEVYTITDEDLIRSISKESVAGTYSDYCCAHSPDGWMEIYRGDCLLRRMDYVSNHGALAYDADITHWVFFGEKGHAFLSNETRQKLETIIGYRGGP